jgi:hypothetical protein
MFDPMNPAPPVTTHRIEVHSVWGATGAPNVQRYVRQQASHPVGTIEIGPANGPCQGFVRGIAGADPRPLRVVPRRRGAYHLGIGCVGCT